MSPFSTLKQAPCHGHLTSPLEYAPKAQQTLKWCTSDQMKNHWHLWPMVHRSECTCGLWRKICYYLSPALLFHLQLRTLSSYSTPSKICKYNWRNKIYIPYSPLRNSFSLHKTASILSESLGAIALSSTGSIFSEFSFVNF